MKIERRFLTLVLALLATACMVPAGTIYLLPTGTANQTVASFSQEPFLTLGSFDIPANTKWWFVNASTTKMYCVSTSAVDAIVQRTRARGIIKGGLTGTCSFEYVLRKDEIGVGDVVISSGVDGVFPKGLRLGEVSEIVRRNAGTFQEVTITPFVDFEKIEEVFIVVNYSRKDK